MARWMLAMLLVVATACTSPQPSADETVTTTTASAVTTTAREVTNSTSAETTTTVPTRDGRSFAVHFGHTSRDGNLWEGVFEAGGAAVRAGLMCRVGVWETESLWIDNASVADWGSVRRKLAGGEAFTLRVHTRFSCLDGTGTFVVMREDDMQGPDTHLRPISPPSIWELISRPAHRVTGSGPATVFENPPLYGAGYSGRLTEPLITANEINWRWFDATVAGFELALPNSFAVVEDPTPPPPRPFAMSWRDRLAWDLAYSDWQPILVAGQEPDNIIVTATEPVPDGVPVTDFVERMKDRWLTTFERLTADPDLEVRHSDVWTVPVRLDGTYTPWATRVDGREAILITSGVITRDQRISQHVYLVAASDDAVHMLSFTSTDMDYHLPTLHAILDTYENSE